MGGCTPAGGGILAWGTVAGCLVGAVGCLRMSIRQVGQVCCLWNQLRKQLVWKMWLHGSFLHPLTISSRHIIHTLSPDASSSGVASGYLVRNDIIYYCDAQIKLVLTLCHTLSNIIRNKWNQTLTVTLQLTYRVFMFLIALLDMMTSFNAFLNVLKLEYSSDNLHNIFMLKKWQTVINATNFNYKWIKFEHNSIHRFNLIQLHNFAAVIRRHNPFFLKSTILKLAHVP